MTRFDIVNLYAGLLTRLDDAGVGVSDVRYAAMYGEYLSMAAAGDKVTYAVARLSERHGVSERTVYNVIRRMGAECVI